jgi:GH15 family glucan-1,4-alpha-glucosidase
MARHVPRAALRRRPHLRAILLAAAERGSPDRFQLFIRLTMTVSTTTAGHYTAGLPASLDLGVIGNCSIAALIDRRARIVWGCFPRFDRDPVFCSLIDNQADDGDALPEKGVFAIEMVGDDALRAGLSRQHRDPVLRPVG